MKITNSIAFILFILGQSALAAIPHIEPEQVISYEQARALIRQNHAQNQINIFDDELSEIIRIGSRAVQLADTAQQNIPVENRHQVWRRIDRLGHEATPDAPMHYNPSTIIAQYNEAISATPQALLAVLEANDPLPSELPQGLSMDEAIIHIRKLNNVYSRASRWLMLSQYRFALRKDSRDYRPWLNLHNNYAQIDDLINQWDSLSSDVKGNITQSITNACAISGMNSLICRFRARQASDSANKVRDFFHEVHENGLQKYRDQFIVQNPHNVTVTQSNQEYVLNFQLKDVPNEIFQWMKHHVENAWYFQNNIRLSLAQTDQSNVGTVIVDWQPGALPHVDSVGGSNITMDSNTALWLEQTQIVMAHEFGHVIGYSDCYSEFWDSDVDSFTYYVLDPSNRMCALSGDTLPLHGDTLRSGFVSP